METLGITQPLEAQKPKPTPNPGATFPDSGPFSNISLIYQGKGISSVYSAECQNSFITKDPTSEGTFPVVIKHCKMTSTTQHEIEFIQRAHKACPEHTLPLLSYQIDASTSMCTIVQPRYGQSLFSLMTQRNRTLEALEVRYIFHQLVTALIKLQNSGIYHLDIKEENVLIDAATHKIKLIDFGLSRDTPIPKGTKVGSSEFCCPEICFGFSSTESLPKHDVWSLGVCLYSCITGNLPYSKLELVVIGREKVDLGRIAKIMRRHGEPKEDTEQLLTLMYNMFELYFKDRVSLEKILDFGYFLDEEAYTARAYQRWIERQASSEISN